MPTTYDLLNEARAIVDAWADLDDASLDLALADYDSTSDDKIRALRAVRVEAANRAAMLKREADTLLTAAKAHHRTVERVDRLATSLFLARRGLGLPTKIDGVGRIQRNGGQLPMVTLDSFTLGALPPSLLKLDLDRAAARQVLEAGGTVPGLVLGERSEGVRWAGPANDPPPGEGRPYGDEGAK